MNDRMILLFTLIVVAVAVGIYIYQNRDSSEGLDIFGDKIIVRAPDNPEGVKLIKKTPISDACGGRNWAEKGLPKGQMAGICLKKLWLEAGCAGLNDMYLSFTDVNKRPDAYWNHRTNLQNFKDLLKYRLRAEAGEGNYPEICGI